MAYELEGIQQLETDEVLDIYNNRPENTELLDVRENEEYNAVHIPGIKLIPTSEFVARFEEELQPDKAYVVVCRTGNRSQMVCQFLKENGFDNCSNYAGGMMEWTGPVEEGNLPVHEHKQRW